MNTIAPAVFLSRPLVERGGAEALGSTRLKMADEPAKKRLKRVILDSDEDEDDEPASAPPPSSMDAAGDGGSDSGTEEEEEQPASAAAAEEGAASSAAPSDAGDEAEAEAAGDENDADASDAGSDGDDDDDDDEIEVASRKKRKKALELELDSDDERLIEENTGVAVERREKSGLKRLSHSRREKGDSEGVKGETAEELQERLFGGEADDDDEAPARGSAPGGRGGAGEPGGGEKGMEKEESVRDDEEDADFDFIVDNEGRCGERTTHTHTHTRLCMLNTRRVEDSMVFYSYVACFMNTVTLNMYISMSYVGFTLRYSYPCDCVPGIREYLFNT